MKKWHFTERIENVTVLQFYTVEAETEAEALAMVESGHGFVDSYTSSLITLEDRSRSNRRHHISRHDRIKKFTKR
jgi:hypothetical protein